MNLDSDIFINNIDSYVEYNYGKKRIGIFGKNIYNPVINLKYLSFAKFLKILTTYKNKDLVYDFYYSDSDEWQNSNVLKVHSPIKLPALAEFMTVQELKLFIRDTIGPLINVKEPVFGEYTRARIVPLLRKIVDTENKTVLLGMVSRMYNVLIVGNILMEMLSDKSANNCIIYVTASQLREFDYFFKQILLLDSVIDVNHKTPFSFNRNEKRLSFLFERTEIKYIRSFDDSYENCGKSRRVSTHDMFLLSMCDSIPLSNVRYIYGPVSYAEFTNGERNIAIFGELHNIPVPEEGIIEKYNTVSVPSLIKIMLDTFPTKFYDLFLEFDYTKVDQPTIFGITSFNQIFGKCIKVVKDCPFDNIRVHYTDYRSVLYNIYAYQTFTWYFQSLNNQDAYQYLINTDPYLTIENLINVFENAVKITKDNILKEPKLKINTETPIYYFVLMELDKLRYDFSYIIDDFKDYNTTDFKDPLTFDEIRIIFVQVMKVYAFFMDMYTLGRLFKSFAPKNTTHPTLALNSVIYAGEMHAYNYRKYLTTVGFKQVAFVETDVGHPLDLEQTKDKSFLFKM